MMGVPSQLRGDLLKTEGSKQDIEHAIVREHSRPDEGDDHPAQRDRDEENGAHDEVGAVYLVEKKRDR
ncbi:hypothetical protein [Salinibacterium xinjiangense]|uniref:hypothetical protein n=2 Tax=Salinibacterium xinjiangense TaxID=386302 RepID=UPI00117B6833|nr:hypothetical protein [Salinibacterium xinjiangense]